MLLYFFALYSRRRGASPFLLLSITTISPSEDKAERSRSMQTRELQRLHLRIVSRSSGGCWHFGGVDCCQPAWNVVLSFVCVTKTGTKPWKKRMSMKPPVENRDLLRRRFCHRFETRRCGVMFCEKRSVRRGSTEF